MYLVHDITLFIIMRVMYIQIHKFKHNMCSLHSQDIFNKRLFCMQK